MKDRSSRVLNIFELGKKIMKSGHKNMSKNMHTVSEDLTCKKAHVAVVKFEIFSGITTIISSSSSYTVTVYIRSPALQRVKDPGPSYVQKNHQN